MKRQALGRGLSALLSDDVQEGRDQLSELEIDSLVPNERQPRTLFDEPALEDLARSIRANGILQPIVVRRDGARFEIIAGERRWRAAKKLGLKKIPALVRDVAPQKSLELALVENIQRQDLNPLEEARAYHALVEEFGLSQEEVATRVGKERSTVANMLRLLRLPDAVQGMLLEGRLSMGHARALLALEAPEKMRSLAERAANDQLSVRQVEELARGGAESSGPAPARRRGKTPKDVHDRAAERRLEQRFGTRVQIRRARRGGRVEIAFFSEEELQRLFEILTENA